MRQADVVVQPGRGCALPSAALRSPRPAPRAGSGAAVLAWPGRRPWRAGRRGPAGRIAAISSLVSTASSRAARQVIGLPPARRAGPSRRCPGRGCGTARRPGTARRRAADAWWARIAARSPSANRPAAAACPSARSIGGGPVQRGELHRPGPSWPGPGRRRRRRPRPATARRRPPMARNSASAAVRGFGVAVQRAGRRGRVVRLVDPRAARRGDLVPGHLGRPCRARRG